MPFVHTEGRFLELSRAVAATTKSGVSTRYTDSYEQYTYCKECPKAVPLDRLTTSRYCSDRCRFKAQNRRKAERKVAKRETQSNN